MMFTILNKMFLKCDVRNNLFPLCSFLFHKMQMQVSQSKYTGLVADMMPNIRLMRLVGHYMHRFSSGSAFLSKVYSTIHLMMFLMQFVFLVINLALNTGEVNELTANTITVLHFTHTITKFLYVAVNGKAVYRTFNIWNQPNSHPLFAESDARYHSIALAKMRKNFYFITSLTLMTVAGESEPRHNKCAIDINALSFLSNDQLGPQSHSLAKVSKVSLTRKRTKPTTLRYLDCQWNLSIRGMRWVASHIWDRSHSKCTICCSRCWLVTSRTFFSARGWSLPVNNYNTWRYQRLSLDLRKQIKSTSSKKRYRFNV